MSITKRYLEGDPSIVGRPSPEDIGVIIDAHTFKLQGRRRRDDAASGWDPFWPNCLLRAEKELSISGINVNGGYRYKTAAERNAVKATTERLWAEAKAAFSARLHKASCITR